MPQVQVHAGAEHAGIGVDLVRGLTDQVDDQGGDRAQGDREG